MSAFFYYLSLEFVFLIQMRQTFKEAPIEGGKLDYEKFVGIIKGSSSEEA